MRYSDCDILHILLYTSYVAKKYWDDCFLPRRKYIPWSLKFLGRIVYIMSSQNDDDDDAKAPPTGVPKDDAMKKGGVGR